MSVTVHHGDCREVLATLPAESVHCCVTSPPYWGLRDYGCAGQIGLEASVGEYVETLVGVFREVKRVLRPDGTVWLNLGDAYAGSSIGGGNGSNSTLAGTHHAQRTGTERVCARITPGLKPKDLIGLPWRVAFALHADGWWLRAENIWHKPNPMPESVEDRTTRAHEQVFMLSKSARYFYDAAAVREAFSDDRQGRDGAAASRERNRGGRSDGLTKPNGIDPSANGGRNLRSVWTIASQPFPEAHFATFPPKLVEPCIKAGCPEGGTVLDPFGGAGTVGLVAHRLGRHATLIELNPDYAAMAERRLAADAPLLAEVAA